MEPTETDERVDPHIVVGRAAAKQVYVNLDKAFTRPAHRPGRGPMTTTGQELVDRLAERYDYHDARSRSQADGTD